MDQELNPNGYELHRHLAMVRAKEAGDTGGRRINVAGVGRLVSTAYEQLRNAAEYTQEHLLRQRAIKRYYVRNLQFHTETKIKPSTAEELIIELTQAGYLTNNTLSTTVVKQLTKAIRKHYGNFWRMRQAGIKYDYAHSLTLDLLSVESEMLVGEDPVQAGFTMFAFHHFKASLPKDAFTKDGQDYEGKYEDNLYIAIHKALRKSDLATIRYDMQRLYGISDGDIHSYVRFFVLVDNIFYSDKNDKLTRYVSRYGAPLRVLQSMAEKVSDMDTLLLDRQRFMDAYSVHIKQVYNDASTKLDKGVVKSIIFLFITKALVGIGIEIPYDILIAGSVAILPLAINLVTPVLYMSLLRFGLKLPGHTNTEAIKRYAETMLYSREGHDLYPAPRKPRRSVAFTVIYTLTSLAVFGLVVTQLIAWDFNIVQGGIFFIFLATASFLGFRLSRIVRELELVIVRPGALATLRDLLYLPFILLGQWLSDKYARINIVALVLDTVIELPLKTILRLMRQWTDFINEKKEEL